MVEPRYPLEKVVAVALGSGDVLLGETRARRIVADYVEGLVEAEQFARAVIASLAVEHFEKSVSSKTRRTWGCSTGTSGRWLPSSSSGTGSSTSTPGT